RPRLRALVRLDQPAMHALALLVRELPGHERPARRWRLGRDQNGLVPTHLVDDAGLLAALQAVPDVTVRPDARAAHAPLEARQGFELPGREGVLVQVVPAVAELEQQERAPVGPPVGDLGEAIPGERDVRDLAGLDVPDRRRTLAAALMADGEAGIAGNRRPTERAQRLAVVVELGLHLAGTGIDDPQRRMDRVAVLGVLEAEE